MWADGRDRCYRCDRANRRIGCDGASRRYRLDGCSRVNGSLRCNWSHRKRGGNGHNGGCRGDCGRIRHAKENTDGVA